MRRFALLPLVCLLLSSVLSHGQTANDDAVTVSSGDSVRIPVLANDEAGALPLDPATVEIASAAGVAGASLTVDGTTGDILYLSGSNAASSDSFSYRVKDTGGNLSNAATVSVTRNTPSQPTSGTVFSLPGSGADVAVPATIGTSGHWFVFGSAASSLLRQSNEGFYFQNNGPSDFRKVAVQIDPASLANSGSTISADFDFQLMNYAGTDAGANGYKFRFGFWDSTDSNGGYFVRLDAGTTEGNTASINKGGDSLGGSSLQLGQTGDTAFVATSVRRSANLTLTRIDGEVVIRLVVDDVVLEKRDSAEVLERFDHFGFLVPSDFTDPGGSNAPTIGVISHVVMNHNAGSGPVAPVTEDDSTSVVQGGNVEVDVLSNDSDSNLNMVPGSVQISSQPSSGSVSVDPDTGKITYAHFGGALGSDSFEYTVADTGGLTSSSATVNVSVSARLQVGVGSPLTIPSDGTCFDVPYTVGENGVWFLTGAQANAAIGVTASTFVLENNSSGTASGDDFRRAVINLAANGGIDLTNPGSFLTAKFTVRLRDYDPRSTDDPDRRFRFGFWDSNSAGQGYTIRMDVGTAVSQTLDIREGGDRLGGNAVPLGVPGTGSAFVARNIDKEVELTMIRTTPAQLDISIKVDNDEYFQTDTDGLLSSFDHFGVMVPKDGNGVEATFSNVQICYLGAAVIPPTAPDVVNDTGSTIQGGDVAVDVLANDSDVNFDLDPTTVAITSQPAAGSVSVNAADGTITYAHAGGAPVPDSFTYTVSDEGGLVSAPATVNIGVAARGQVIQGIPLMVPTDGSVLPVPGTIGENGFWHQIGATVDSTINITGSGGLSLVNDSSSDDFRRAAINLTTSGMLNLDSPGSVLSAKFIVSLIGYDPRPSDSPDRRFRFGFWNSSDNGKGYTVRMDPGEAEPASIDIRAGGDRLGGTAATVGVQGLDSDFFVGSDETEIELTLERVSSSAVQISVKLGNGKVYSVLDSSSLFDTSTLFSSFDYFGFMVPKDGNGVEAILNNIEVSYRRGATVSPMPPVATNDSSTVVQGGDVSVDVLANDTDPNFNLDPGSVSIVSNPEKGSVSVNLETGEITYSHAGGTFGIDAFTYRVRDAGGMASNTATVTIAATARLQVANGSTFFVPSTGICVPVPLTIGENGVWHQIGNASGSEIDVI
ncbi:MAG: Ig-like domain-containing protein, partial [Verrucomicrobiota bacterium]